MKAAIFLRRRQRGSTVVETALVAPVVLLLMFAILEFSIIFFTTMSMQYAVREGARYGITGRTDKDTSSTPARFQAMINVMRNSSAGMYDMVAPVISVNGTTYASAGNYSNSMFGGPDDIVVIRLDCSWTLRTPLIGAFFKNGKLNFAVAATMKNEAWSTQ
jgi:Flp pilus assembly protein TadG